MDRREWNNQHLIGNVLVDITLADQTFSTLGEYPDRWVRDTNGAWLLSAREKSSHATVGTFDAFKH
jgi:hypothetical protein